MYIPEDDDFVNDERASALLEEMNNELTSRLLPVTIFVGIEASIGFIGNSLVVFLFAFYYKPCNYRTFSICLSLIDLTCTFTTMAGEMVTQRYWFNYPVKEICKTKDFFNICTVSAETFTLLVISIDRYRKICQPLKWQIGPKAAVILCFVSVFAAGAIASPIVEFWGVRTYTKEYKNTTVLITTCEKDEKYEDTKFPFGYVAVVGGIIFIFLVAMFVLNVAVAKRLIYERRRGMLTKQRPDTTKKSANTGSTEQSVVSTSNVTVEVPSDVRGGPTGDACHDDVAIVDSGVYTGEPESITNGDIKQTEGVKDVPDNTNGVAKTHGSAHQYNVDGSTTKVANNVPENANGVAKRNESSHKADVERKTNGHVKESPENSDGVGSKRKLTPSEINAQRIRRKALIMFILTSTFICTTIMYFTMVSILGSAGNIVNGMSAVGKTLFFFFLRFYFIQHIINPILYVMLDPQIKSGLMSLLGRKK